ncbi:MAG: putative transcriptional regulator [Planctomycetota bacterium]
MLTDALRALLLEAHGYKTKVFEFISTEHTPKNVLIVGVKNKEVKEPDAEIMEQIQSIKKTHGIDFHYLEKLLMNDLKFLS